MGWEQREGLAGWKLPLLVHMGWAVGAHPWVCQWMRVQQNEQDEALSSPVGSLRFSTWWGTYLKGSNTGALGMCLLPAGIAGKSKRKNFY